MAKIFEDGFPGQAQGQGNAHVLDAGLEPGTPPVNVTDLPETKPVMPDTEPTFDLATGLPIIAAEQAFNHAPFNDDEDVPGDEPDFLDFF